MPDQSKVVRFEEIALPHLSAAYNLARWLVRDESDAEDIVQEAYLRAFKFFGGYYGGDSRAWLLTIVRNTCYTWLQQNRVLRLAEPIDDKIDELGPSGSDPETLLLQSVDSQTVRDALQELPVEFREVMVLREMEGLSYKEIANVVDIPIGTVTSGRDVPGSNALLGYFLKFDAGWPMSGFFQGKPIYYFSMGLDF